MKKILYSTLLLLSGAVSTQSYADCTVGEMVSTGERVINGDFFRPLVKGVSKDPMPFAEAWAKAGFDPNYWNNLDPFEFIAIRDGKGLKFVPVGDYLDQIKQTAKCFNDDYKIDILSSAEIPEKFAEWADSAQDVAANIQQAKEIVDSIKNFDPKKSAERIGKDFVNQKFDEAIASGENPTLSALYGDVQEYKEIVDSFEPIPVPKIPFRDDLDSITDKSWKASFGTRQTFLAELNAKFKMGAKGSEAQAGVEANGFVQVFGSDPLYFLKANYKVDISNTKGLTTEGQLWVMGHTVDDGMDSAGPFELKGESGNIPLVDVAEKYFFTIGPIPCSGKIGAAGNANLGYHFGAVGLTATGSLAPSVLGKAYLEVAIDVYVASIGFGGELILIEASAGLTGWASVLFDEHGKPSVINGINAEATLTLLKGNFYAFAEISLPAPLNHKFTQYLWQEKGKVSKLSGLAVNFQKKVSQGKILVEGDAEHADLTAVKLDQEKMDMLAEIEVEMRRDVDLVNPASSSAMKALSELESQTLTPLMASIATW